ncbi:transposase [Reinekea sp.]|jgi:REP element-mobilizing transposase RayT|uniref:transposase n=1 Tax=Reinekea sp. TaxID=1970455 RepID=UPI002A823BE0|nr:transposase [Reinekea sp.]
MPKPRYSQVSLDETPYYHCVSRCVRRAFLCGIDIFSGQNYDHRRSWIENRILQLGQIFCIDICAYAVMSNHYHVVLHVNVPEQANLSLEEVIQRWHSLYRGNQLVHRFLQDEPLCAAERVTLQDMAEQWRERLGNISWFMKALNEGVARDANIEDKCTGRFWEGRFKSQALLDEQALAACMAYVDLNPIRAKMTNTPETSNHTAVQKRIAEVNNTPQDKTTPNQPATLFPFVGNPRKDMPQGLPFKLEDYLELVDWTARTLRDTKRGVTSQKASTVLQRLKIEPRNWLYASAHFESSFRRFAGTIEKIRSTCANLGHQRLPRSGVLLS